MVQKSKGFVLRAFLLCSFTVRLCDTTIILDHLQGIYYYFRVRAKSWLFFCPQRFFLLWNLLFCDFGFMLLPLSNWNLHILWERKVSTSRLSWRIALVNKIHRFLTEWDCFHISQLGCCWFCQTNCFGAILKIFNYGLVRHRIFDLMLSNPARVWKILYWLLFYIYK